MVVTDAEPPQPARSSRPASAIGPPRGLGGAARCCASRDGGYTPEKAMTLLEARQFVQSLTRIWLTWRIP
jgi:hypothetical protein